MRTLFSLTAALILAGCSPDPPPETLPFVPVADVRQLMLTVIEPAAEIYWDSVGTIMDLDGTEEIAPSTAEEWTAVRNAAMVVAESGNLLLTPGRSMDNEEWIALAREMIDSGRLALVAAEARDPISVFEAGGDLYLVCSECHATFAPDVLRPNYLADP